MPVTPRQKRRNPRPHCVKVWLSTEEREIVRAMKRHTKSASLAATMRDAAVEMKQATLAASTRQDVIDDLRTALRLFNEDKVVGAQEAVRRALGKALIDTALDAVPPS